MSFKDLYGRLLRYSDSLRTSEDGLVHTGSSTFFDKYVKTMSEDECRNILVRMLSGHPSPIGGWDSVDRAVEKIGADSPSELEIRLTLLGM